MSLVVDALKKLKTENNPPQATPVDVTDQEEINYIEDDGKNTSLHKPILATALILAATAAIVTAAIIFTDKDNPIASKAVIVAQKDTNVTQTAPSNKNTATKPTENTPQQAAKATAQPTTTSAAATPKQTQAQPTTSSAATPKQTQAKPTTSSAAAATPKQTQAKPTTSSAAADGAKSHNPAGDFFASWGSNTPSNTAETTAAHQQSYSDPLKAVNSTPPNTKDAKASSISYLKNSTPPNTEETPLKATAPKDTTAQANKTPSKYLQPNVMPIFITPQPADSQALAAAAKNAFDKKDYNTALKYYLKAYELNQEQPLAENIAMIYVLTGNPSEGIKTVKDAKINNTTAISSLISQMTALAYFYEANELIKYSSQFKDNGELAYAEGKYYLNTQNYPKAEAAFKRAASLNPKNAQYLVAYAEITESQGNVQQAKEMYIKALELNPSPQLKKQIQQKISQ